MAGYQFPLGCLHCGGPLVHTADGRPHTDSMRSEVQAVAMCVGCRRSHRVTVRVVSELMEAKLLAGLENGKFVDKAAMFAKESA